MADEGGNGGGNDVGGVFKLVLVSIVLRQVAAYGAKYIVPRAERSMEVPCAALCLRRRTHRPRLIT